MDRVYLKPLLLLVLLIAGAVWWLYEPLLVVGAAPSEARKVVVLLHGYGAPGDDLRSLAEELHQKAPDLSFILPAGKHNVGVGGRSWYESIRAGSKEELARLMAEQKAVTREELLEIIRDLGAEGVATENVVIGGFSQGANVSLDLILHAPVEELPRSLLWLSGGNRPFDLTPLSSRPPLAVFVSHGNSDKVVSIATTQQLLDALEGGNHRVTWIEFEGGHQITPDVRKALVSFLGE